MEHTQITEREAKERKIKATLAIKFGTIKEGSIQYYRALADREATI